MLRVMVLALVACIPIGAPIGCRVPTEPEPTTAPTSTEATMSAETRAVPPASDAPVRTLVPVPSSPAVRAALLADRTTLAEEFAADGVEVPDGTHLLAARIVEGVGQPALEWYSLGDTGFVSSDARFWPASTVKLAAAVSALVTLAEAGLDGDTVVAFDDVYGGYEGTVDALLEAALVPSDNAAYNRLALIAGLDAIHQRDFRPDDGFEHFVLQRFYVKPVPEASLRTSPAITWRHGSREGLLAARQATGDYTRCPHEGNCVSLFELLEIVRRVVLHDELPAARRFAVPDPGVRRLRELLVASPSKFTRGVVEALGHDEVTIYNKAGKVRGDDHLDAALVVDERTGARWLLAASVPYTTASRDEDATTQAQLERLAAATLRVLLDPARPHRGAPAQDDAGEVLDTTAGDWSGGDAAGRRWTVARSIELGTARGYRAWFVEEAGSL